MKSLLFFALAITNITYAQTHELNEIEVTEVRGNKDEKPFLETNESVSVLKPKSLNRSDLPNSIQMLNGLGNVQTQSDRTGEAFSIRGISDMGVTGFQKDNLASVLVDEIFQTTLALRAGSFENWDLHVLEVRRGAQSTDQGVNSLAGNILLYHHAPVFQDEGQAKFSVGSYGRYEGAFVINKKISDKFSSRTSYNREQADGYIENTTTNNDKWNESKKDHFSQDFLYRLSSKDEVRLNFKLLRMHRGGNYVQGDFEDYEVSEDQDYKEITNSQQAGLYYNRRISETISNRLILGATRATSTTRLDEDGTENNTAGTRNVNDKDYFLSLENQLKYKSDNMRNVFGIHLHRYYLTSFYRMNMLLAPNTDFPVTQENIKYRDSYAIFDTFTYDLTRKHSLILGGRLDVVKNEFGADIDASQTPFPNLSGLHQDEVTNSVFLPKIGYNFHEGNYSIGATYSQGYRTGGVSVNRAELTTNEYGPERTHNYELSYKFQKERSVLALNLFYTKWNDQQVELDFGSFNTRVENAAESELYGAEFETSHEFTNQDSVRFNIGYVHTQFLSFSNNGESFTGNSFPDSAPVTAQLSYWKFLSEKWMLILVSRYLSETYTDVQNDRSSPEQFYTDINTQYNFDQYMLEFYVRNVFNQKYRLLDGSPRSASSPYQGDYHRVSSPVQFGARLNYYW